MEPARDADAGLVTEDGPAVVDVTLEVTSDKRGGLFCNAAGIYADADSVTIDFASVDPGPAQSAILQARVRLSQRMAVRLLESLAANARDWLPRELKERDRERAVLESLLARLSEQGDGDD